MFESSALMEESRACGGMYWGFICEAGQRELCHTIQAGTGLVPLSSLALLYY